MAGAAITYNDCILELASIIGNANPKPKEVLSPLHLLDFTSEERVLTVIIKSIRTTKISRRVPIEIPSLTLLTSLKARIGGHKMQDAVEILVFWTGPKSRRSGNNRALLNRMSTGPNLENTPDWLSSEKNSHNAPVETRSI